MMFFVYNMYKTITEGKAKIKVPVETKISKELPVFYNPVMELNRTISVLVLTNIPNKNMQMCSPLSGTGVREIRFIKELPANKIKQVSINDYSTEAVKIIKENLKLNGIKNKTTVTCEDANMMMLKSSGFDYIDIDPFGTPNPFLDSAIKRLAREGILAITATDTSALCGTHPKVCQRKYWAKPLHNHMMHETGIRILTRKIQLIGAQYEKALTPIYSHSTEHYMRIYFKCEKGKKKVDEIIKKHEMFMNAGPMWTGKLWDEKLSHKIATKTDNKMLKTIEEESKIETVGFYDTHQFCKKNKQKIPQTEKLIEEIIKKGFQATRTHFNDYGIKSNMQEKELLETIKQINRNA